MTSWPFVLLALYVLTCAVCGVWSTVIMARMVGMVNPGLPEDQRFALNWWSYGKTRRLMKTYRHLYPAGPHTRQLRTTVMVPAFLAVGMAILFWIQSAA
jgi:hypothetical protein